MGRPENLLGRKFGRLSVIGDVPSLRRQGGTRKHWLCQCDCGKQAVVQADHLRSGHTVSCGCIWADICRKHGHGHDENGQQSRTYKAWVNMRSRVSGLYDQYDTSYLLKGIKVCETWSDSFEAFLSDMGECPAGMSLDRIDNNGNYEPSNCRWATIDQQNENRDCTRFIEFRGERMLFLTACSRFKIHPATLQHRLARGMTAEEALTVPIKKRTKSIISQRKLVLEYGTEWMMH